VSKQVRSTLGGVAALVALCALPAHGQQPTLTPKVLYGLTSIDTAPTREDLQSILESPANELSLLRQYALGTNVDFGVRLRATRALSHFCMEQPVECRATLTAVFDDIDASPDSPGKILRRRAAIEALGDTRTGDPADVPRLLSFLDDPSRDIRVAAVRALRDRCIPTAIQPLRDRLRSGPSRVPVETVEQVRKAIEVAIDVLGQCGQ
jgi:HEAT repeat protein